jgi:hypothetical protein
MSAIASIGESVLTVAVTLAGGWLVTRLVTDHWDQIKVRRDENQAAAHQFQQLYGEVIAIWKTWNALKGGYTAKFATPDEAKWDCLLRATAAEGEIEALLARLAAERYLTDDDIDVLGGLRQAFKAVRRKIREDEPIDWPSSNAKKYVALKTLAAHTSVMLTSPVRTDVRPGEDESARAFIAITDNRHERTWTSAGN